MRKILVTVTAVLVALQPNVGITQTLSEVIEVESGQRLQLRSDLGRVEITGYSDSEVKVIVEVRGLDDDEFKVDINKDAAGVRIDGELTKTRWFHASNRRIRFDIRVPREFDIDVNTEGGSISVVNIAGDKLAKTPNLL